MTGFPPLQLFVHPLPQELPATDRSTAVVIDVLRATSVMATALAHGASEIVTCLTIDDAFKLAATMSPRPLLCGERHCQPIAGFDLGNSPAEYRAPHIANRTLIMTTTNGTKALAAARQANQVYAGAFINLAAVASRIADDEHVHLVCAGTDGIKTEEDMLFAGALIARLRKMNVALTLDESAIAVESLWQGLQGPDFDLAAILSSSRGGRNLVEAGFARDVQECAQVDVVDVVPRMMTADPITLNVG